MTTEYGVRFVLLGEEQEEEHVVGGSTSALNAAREMVQIVRRHAKYGKSARDYRIVKREVTVTPWVPS
jgi:hypothetical protein